MSAWADREAELIVDAFVADQGPDDLLHLQEAIADALRHASEKERAEDGE